MSAEKYNWEKLAQQIGIACTNDFWKTKFNLNHALQPATHWKRGHQPLSQRVGRKDDSWKDGAPLCLKTCCCWRFAYICAFWWSFVARVLQQKIALSRDCSVSTCCGMVLLVSKKHCFLKPVLPKNGGMLLCRVTAVQTYQSASQWTTENEYHVFPMRKYTCCLKITPRAI